MVSVSLVERQRLELRLAALSSEIKQVKKALAPRKKGTDKVAVGVCALLALEPLYSVRDIATLFDLSEICVRNMKHTKRKESRH